MNRAINDDLRVGEPGNSSRLTSLPPSGKPSMRSLREGRAISLRDVAKLAEVSVATVSMVLNDNPRISRATQLRVQQVIDKTGYRPNRLAQSLSSRYTCVIAVLLPALRHGFGDAYFGEMISGICDKAGKLGGKTLVPPVEIPTGTFAWFADPDGNTIGLWKPK